MKSSGAFFSCGAGVERACKLCLCVVEKCAIIGVFLSFLLCADCFFSDWTYNSERLIASSTHGILLSLIYLYAAVKRDVISTESGQLWLCFLSRPRKLCCGKGKYSLHISFENP